MDYKLIGGITLKNIIDCIPIFDALTSDFWIYANEYIPSDFIKTHNAQIVQSIRSNFWLKHLDNVVEFENNDLSISYIITDDILYKLSIAHKNTIIFQCINENI